MAEPNDEIVHWSRDPQQARTIHCDVCRKCRWRDGSRHGYCLYGGPFDGYVMPDEESPTKVRI
jgi:hypothetical protein